MPILGYFVDFFSSYRLKIISKAFDTDSLLTLIAAFLQISKGKPML